MPSGINNSALIRDYEQGRSIPQLAVRYSLNLSAARKILRDAGVLRSRSDAIRLAGSQGRLGGGMRGKNRVFTPEHKDNIKKGRQEWGRQNAAGTSVKDGYVVHTVGPDKGRGVHVTIMEKRLGRRLKPDEEVHHVDRDRSNNDENNLALLTNSGHRRLHRFEDAIAGKKIERTSNGRFR